LKGSSIHLTFHFLGEVDPKRKKALIGALDGVLPGQKPFPVRIDRLGSFSRGGTATILWAGLERSDLLSGLHRQLTQGLSKAGFETESRPFSPHITLARPLPGGPEIPQINLEPFTAPRPEPLTCQLDHLTLISSVLDPTGSRYQVLKEYRFV
jgi:2'-5' RNA ligase